MTDRALKIELFDQFARVAQAAASGRRVEIVDVLANGERSVEELSRQVAMSVANTSRHLHVLKEAGLVAATREGTRVRYRLASPAVFRFWVALRSLAAERLPGVQGLVEAYLGSREGLEAISGDELLARLRSGEPLVVVDVRPAEEYQLAHVAGAVSIPLAELEQRLRELPREREVVAYCRGPYCAFAPEAARTLREHGYAARYLSDGLPEWAEAYEALWSPIIRPVGERLIARLPLSSTTRSVVDIGTGAGALLPAIKRAAPSAVIVGVDRSQGMLRLAKDKHSGPLALMDVQNLALPANRFQVAVVAFVLFHLPYPEQCLAEVNRVLQRKGAVGTVTWGSENMAPANAVWDDELQAAGAQMLELPAVDNRACCDSAQKMTALLGNAGFGSIKVWSESIEHRWRPEVHFDYQVRSTSRQRLLSLTETDRAACLGRVRRRLSAADGEQYLYQGEVFMATAVKADHPSENC